MQTPSQTVLPLPLLPLLVLALLTPLSSPSKFQLTITCQPCTISCSYPNCYRLTYTSSSSSNYTSQQCGKSSCNLSTNYNTTIGDCSYTTEGSCSSGVCEYRTQVNYCQITTDVGGVCSSTYSVSVTCGACVNSSCSNCINTYTQTTGNKQVCFPVSCSNFENVSYSLGPCPNGKDANGNTCACCKNSTNNNVGYCTSNSQIFSSSEFNTWAKAKANFQWGKLIQIWAVLLLVLGAACAI